MHSTKTRSAVKKRFHVNCNGVIKHAHKNKNHILNKKTRKRKRHLRQVAYVAKADVKNIKTQLGM